MDTMVQDARREVGSRIKMARWALGLNGLLSVIFGALIIIWPNISLYSLVIVFGAFSLARGVVGLGAAIGSRMKQGRGWLALWSLVSIAVGVIVFVRTDMSALALLYVIGAYAIALGIVAVGGAFWLPLDGSDRLALLLTGAVSILFGVVMFAEPGAGALVLLALIAAFSLTVGISELLVAIGGKRLLEYQIKRVFPKPKATPQPTA